MQYKIPIQIENEDTIIFDLSLRQIGIIIIGVVLAFGVFNKFEGQVANTPLFILCVLLVGVFVVIAKFRTHEMTFLPFVLNLLRFKINGNGAYGEGRVWKRGVDSYSVLEIGYVRSEVAPASSQKREKNTTELTEKLKKI